MWGLSLRGARTGPFVLLARQPAPLVFLLDPRCWAVGARGVTGAGAKRLSTGVPSGPCLPTQASPPVLCPRGRTRDLGALLAVMAEARRFIYVSVMEYFPTTRFSRPARWVCVAASGLEGGERSANGHTPPPARTLQEGPQLARGP